MRTEALTRPTILRWPRRNINSFFIFGADFPKVREQVKGGDPLADAGDTKDPFYSWVGGCRCPLRSSEHPLKIGEEVLADRRFQERVKCVVN